MTTQEAKQALRDGLKIRREPWGDGTYLEKAKDGSVLFPDGSPVPVPFFEANEWSSYPKAEAPKIAIEMLKV